MLEYSEECDRCVIKVIFFSMCLLKHFNSELYVILLYVVAWAISEPELCAILGDKFSKLNWSTFWQIKFLDC